MAFGYRKPATAVSGSLELGSETEGAHFAEQTWPIRLDCDPVAVISQLGIDALIFASLRTEARLSKEKPLPEVSEDPLLEDLRTIEGFKILPPCLLYGTLGRGGMGVVYAARHLKLDIDVAVKCLRAERGEGERWVERFTREAQLAARVNHSNLVRAYDVFEFEGIYYQILELVLGETASARLSRKRRFKPEEALTIVLRCADAMAAAHRQGIIHRDLKPANILISADGDVKVADLGLAKALHSDEELTVAGARVGTPPFMPPEQWIDFKEVGPPGDVYSLGTTLYYLITKKSPLRQKAQAAMLREVHSRPYLDLNAIAGPFPDEYVELVKRCTMRQPEERYQDAGALALAIRRILGGHEFDLADPEGDGVTPQMVDRRPSPAQVEKARMLYRAGAFEERGGTVSKSSFEASAESAGDSAASGNTLEQWLARLSILLELRSLRTWLFFANILAIICFLFVLYSLRS